MQEMQAFSSTLPGSFGSIACTGHSRAQTPHPVQALVGLGIMPEPPGFL